MKEIEGKWFLKFSQPDKTKIVMKGKVDKFLDDEDYAICSAYNFQSSTYICEWILSFQELLECALFKNEMELENFLSNVNKNIEENKN